MKLRIRIEQENETSGEKKNTTEMVPSRMAPFLFLFLLPISCFSFLCFFLLLCHPFSSLPHFAPLAVNPGWGRRPRKENLSHLWLTL